MCSPWAKHDVHHSSGFGFRILCRSLVQAYPQTGCPPSISPPSTNVVCLNFKLLAGACPGHSLRSSQIILLGSCQKGDIVRGNNTHIDLYYLTRRLARNSGKIPARYQVDRDSLNREPTVIANGFFADVRKGKLGDKVVAVRILKVNRETSGDSSRKVCVVSTLQLVGNWSTFEVTYQVVCVERPATPDNAEQVGFGDGVWELVEAYWVEELTATQDQRSIRSRSDPTHEDFPEPSPSST